MTINDGNLVGAPVRLLPFGPAPGNANILLLAEGYLGTQLRPPANNSFAEHCQQLVHHITAQPWYRNNLRLNIYRQDVASTQEGADIAAGCNVPPRTVATYFDATYSGGGVCRVLTGNDATVTKAAAPIAHAMIGKNAEFDATIVLVNSAFYGGSSSKPHKVVWVSARDPGFPDIALHELGHVAGLGDEYGYYESRCGGYCRPNGWDPIPTNVDNSATQPKWLPEVTLPLPLPTLPNPDQNPCACAYDPDEAVLAPFGDGVGTFEGSGWYHCGLYRPSAHCKMRKIESPFCKVCVGDLLKWLS